MCRKPHNINQLVSPVGDDTGRSFYRRKSVNYSVSCCEAAAHPTFVCISAPTAMEQSFIITITLYFVRIQ
jgi:hypothetical protein